MVAIRDACRALKTFQLPDCTLYASCEPCPMCLSAVYWARIPTVYFGATRDDAAAVGFDDELIYREISLPRDRRQVSMRGLLRDEALASFGVWSGKTDKVPY